MVGRQTLRCGDSGLARDIVTGVGELAIRYAGAVQSQAVAFEKADAAQPPLAFVPAPFAPAAAEEC